MKVKFFLEIGLGEGISEVVEVADGMSEEQIEDEFLEWRAGHLDSGWSFVEDGEKTDG